jgi:hypothetical protein
MEIQDLAPKENQSECQNSDTPPLREMALFGLTAWNLVSTGRRKETDLVFDLFLAAPRPVFRAAFYALEAMAVAIG